MDDVTVYYTASLEVYPRVYQATYHALDRQKDRYVNHVDVTDTRDQSQEYNRPKILRILMQSLRILPKIAVWQRLTHRPDDPNRLFTS